MRRLISFFLVLTLLATLTACGGTAVPEDIQSPPSQESSPPESVEPETPPEPEPYLITSPTVMPEGGSRDGVTYAAWDGIVEHLFFHPVIAYPELAFDGDNQANGLDDFMVTVDEYNKILQSEIGRAHV